MTKEEVLQKVNDYCTEKAYTNETLTDAFKDKFATHFQKMYPEQDINDESVNANMKFALNTAFSGASTIITEKTNAFTAKETEYKRQIEELNKKLGNKTETTTPPTTIPKEIQDQLDELQKFKNLELKDAKKKEIVKLAKAGIRQDLHSSFDTFAYDYDVNLDGDTKEQATKWVERFQAIFKDSIGDIKPLAPRQTQKRDDEYLDNMPTISVE